MAKTSKDLYKELQGQLTKAYGKKVAAAAVNDPQADRDQDTIFARIKRETNARLAADREKNQRTANSQDATLLRKLDGPAFQSVQDIIKENEYVKNMKNVANENSRKMEGIVSTAIQNVDYDPDKKIAYVNFTDGDTTYAFPNVSQNEMKGWMNSGSKGGYYNSMIKKKAQPNFRSSASPTEKWWSMTQ